MSMNSPYQYQVMKIILWNMFLMFMGLKWIFKQLTRPPVQCVDHPPHLSKAKAKAKAKANAKAPFLEPEAEPQERRIPSGPSQPSAGETTSLREIFHTSKYSCYHLSGTCPQLAQARDINKKVLCMTYFHSVQVSEIRRNDAFNRGDTTRRFQAYDHASTNSHMSGG